MAWKKIVLTSHVLHRRRKMKINQLETAIMYLANSMNKTALQDTLKVLNSDAVRCEGKNCSRQLGPGDECYSHSTARSGTIYYCLECYNRLWL